MNPTDLPPVDSPTRPRPPVRRFARTSRWLIAILLIFGGLYALQQLSAPQVDESLISPVVISQAAGSGTPVAESPAVDNIEATANSILAGITQESIDAAEHPNLPLLEVARAGLKEIDKTIQDYQATLVSQVFARGKLHDENYMFVKIRHQHETDDGSTVPFSVYTKFLKPVQKVGQEAIWVQGQNEGKLIAHTTGLMNVKRFYLDPKGPIAMQGNRYPIETIGFRNLLEKIIEFGEKDIQYGECEVTITRNVQINGRSCIVLEAVHPQKKAAL